MNAAAPVKAVTVRLDRSAPKRTSVRYDAPLDQRAAVRTLYLDNEAAAALGQPEAIIVTIAAAG